MSSRMGELAPLFVARKRSLRAKEWIDEVQQL